MPSGFGNTVPQQRKKLRLEQVNWLLENYTEPEYMPDSTNNMATLSTTFEVDYDMDLEGYNPCGITMAILNYRTTWNNKTNDLTYYSAAAFMRNIQRLSSKEITNKRESLESNEFSRRTI